MTQTTFCEGFVTLANMPGNKCVEVYWDPFTGTLYIKDCKEEAEVPDTATKVSAGQPANFVNLLRSLLTQFED